MIMAEAPIWFNRGLFSLRDRTDASLSSAAAFVLREPTARRLAAPTSVGVTCLAVFDWSAQQPAIASVVFESHHDPAIDLGPHPAPSALRHESRTSRLAPIIPSRGPGVVSLHPSHWLPCNTCKQSC